MATETIDCPPATPELTPAEWSAVVTALRLVAGSMPEVSVQAARIFTAAGGHRPAAESALAKFRNALR